MYLCMYERHLKREIESTAGPEPDPNAAPSPESPAGIAQPFGLKRECASKRRTKRDDFGIARTLYLILYT